MMESCITKQLPVFLWVILHLSLISAKLCPSSCDQCSELKAECTTRDGNPFPQTLDPGTESIDINYRGSKSFQLTASSINRYTELRNLSLTGNIDLIADGSMKVHHSLEKLIINHAKIKSIPENLFGTNLSFTPRLKTLILNHNQLTVIPSIIFERLVLIEYLDLSYNPLEICNGNNSIGDQFRNLTNLETLNLGGLGDLENCRSIDEHFFDPLQHVIKLNLSRTGLFNGTQRILRPLVNIEDLSLDDVYPYNKCPSSAKDLFSNLSNSTKYLQARRWRSTASPNQNCSFTRHTLQGLAKLPHLIWLDFEYGDKLFGNRLTRTLFQDFKHLNKLNLAWCGIADIEYGALDGLQINSLDMNGNSIGPREFWLTERNRSMRSMGKLFLKQCGINADETLVFNAYFIVKSLPMLELLDLSRNMLLSLPKFKQDKHSNLTFQLRMHLHLFGNMLQTLLSDEMEELCSVMPNLLQLDLSTNRVKLVEYLCPKIEDLDFRNNQLGNNHHQATNLNAIRKLRNLIFLGLSNNDLSYIPPDLFQSMRKLQTLWLARNKLTHLDNSLLSNNHGLLVLSLSDNSLQSFNSCVLANTVNIANLQLAGNQISHLDPDFIEFAEHTTSLTEIDIGNNPFDCSCGQLYFQAWVLDEHNQKLLHGNMLKCDTPGPLKAKRIAKYKQPLFDCYGKWVLIAFSVLVFVVVVVLLCVRSRWYIEHWRYVVSTIYHRLQGIKHLDTYKYDAMIIFNPNSDSDVELVTKLMIELEGDNYLEPLNHGRQPPGRKNKVYLRLRDDLTGAVAYEQYCQAIEQSRKIILIASNAFLQDTECVAQCIHAGKEFFKTAKYNPTRTKVIELEDLDDDLLRDAEISSLFAESESMYLPKKTMDSTKKMKIVWRKLQRFVEQDKPAVTEERTSEELTIEETNCHAVFHLGGYISSRAIDLYEHIAMTRA